jgi:5'-nucleotidase
MPRRILVTNDDGIDAPGLKVLEKIARTLSDDVWVVAPETEQSGAGHSLSLQVPLRYRKIDTGHFAVKGTPTDCVLMAVSVIVPSPIDLVLSGINRGQNIAEDITHSGTVAAAMEGTLCDIPSIALSQALDYGKRDPDIKVHWDTAQTHAPKLIRTLLAQEWEHDTMFNVNFPNCTPDKVKGTKLVAHGKHDLTKKLTQATDPNGRPYYWLSWTDDGFDPRRPDADIEWLFKDYVTVTPVCLNLTNNAVLKRLKKTIEA